jgi:hypothetical protein
MESTTAELRGSRSLYGVPRVGGGGRPRHGWLLGLTSSIFSPSSSVLYLQKSDVADILALFEFEKVTKV